MANFKELISTPLQIQEQLPVQNLKKIYSQSKIKV